LSLRTSFQPRSRTAVAAAGVAVALLAPAAITATGLPSASASPQSAPAPSSSVDRHHDAKAKPRFPGHRPGHIYLGMSCGGSCAGTTPRLGGNIGVHRWFKKWGDWRGVGKAIQEDRRNHQLPWISIEGPDRGAPNGWRAVGRGRYDRDIRELAQVLKANDHGAAFISFDHEPSNKAPTSEGKWWAHGYIRFYDQLRKAHALRHVAVPPIMASWLFGKYNHEDRPTDWVTAGVLRRAPFLAVDLYQDDTGDTYRDRLPRIAHWLGRHGHPHMMLGLGETGATNSYRGQTGKSAVEWLNQSFSWAAHHPGRVAVISYFNTNMYSAPNVYWPLDESGRKMDVFRRWLHTKPFINHVR
jgi:hypothetical protein